ncbi:hypothetical protein [Streptomyces flaveus]|uniref:hypothetical protein n=1 Tax=Streptomyces flaveus TaxID=66370 RepID=UPI0033228FE7
MDHRGVLARSATTIPAQSVGGYDDCAARTARTSACARGSAVTVLRKPFVT